MPWGLAAKGSGQRPGMWKPRKRLAGMVPMLGGRQEGRKTLFAWRKKMLRHMPAARRKDASVQKEEKGTGEFCAFPFRRKARTHWLL